MALERFCYAPTESNCDRRCEVLQCDIVQSCVSVVNRTVASIKSIIYTSRLLHARTSTIELQPFPSGGSQENGSYDFSHFWPNDSLGRVLRLRAKFKKCKQPFSSKSTLQATWNNVVFFYDHPGGLLASIPLLGAL